MSAPSEDTIVSLPLHKRQTSSDEPDVIRSWTHDQEGRPRHDEKNYEENEQPHLGRGEEKVRLDTLGEGLSAPQAADEIAEEAGREHEDVSPGLKGWINLFGVSGVFHL